MKSNLQNGLKKNHKKLGYSKIIRGDIGICPDFIMLKNGEETRVELETYSSNFNVHKHSLEEVDEIVCLVKDVVLGKPIIEARGVEFSLPRKVTLSLNDEAYKEFQEFCEENDIMLSKRIERLIKEHVKENKKPKGGKKRK